MKESSTLFTRRLRYSAIDQVLSLLCCHIRILLPYHTKFIVQLRPNLLIIRLLKLNSRMKSKERLLSDADEQQVRVFPLRRSSRFVHVTSGTGKVIGHQTNERSRRRGWLLAHHVTSLMPIVMVSVSVIVVGSHNRRWNVVALRRQLTLQLVLSFDFLFSKEFHLFVMFVLFPLVLTMQLLRGEFRHGIRTTRRLSLRGLPLRLCRLTASTELTNLSKLNG